MKLWFSEKVPTETYYYLEKTGCKEIDEVFPNALSEEEFNELVEDDNNSTFNCIKLSTNEIFLGNSVNRFFEINKTMWWCNAFIENVVEVPRIGEPVVTLYKRMLSSPTDFSVEFDEYYRTAPSKVSLHGNTILVKGVGGRWNTPNYGLTESESIVIGHGIKVLALRLNSLLREKDRSDIMELLEK